MSIKNFFPQVWMARFLVALPKFMVYTQTGVVNRDFEGQISAPGDVVRINEIGKVTIKDYARNTDLDAPEQLQSAQLTMTIDQAKYFNFGVDNLDAAQANVNVMDRALEFAASDVVDLMDQHMASKWSEASADNRIGEVGNAVVPTKADAYEYLVDLEVLLDDARCPKEGRFCVVPPWFHGLLQKDDRFVHATASGDQVIKSGVIGEAANFTVLKSHNVPEKGDATEYKLIAGHPLAWSFAHAVTEMEAYKPERRFGDAVKGLEVYGGKVIRPECLAVMIASKN